MAVDLEQIADLGQFSFPPFIGSEAAEEFLDFGALAPSDRLDAGHDLAATRDGEALSLVLDRIEESRKAPCGIGGTHFRHEIRLSDSDAADPASVSNS